MQGQCHLHASNEHPRVPSDALSTVGELVEIYDLPLVVSVLERFGVLVITVTITLKRMFCLEICMSGGRNNRPTGRGKLTTSPCRLKAQRRLLARFSGITQFNMYVVALGFGHHMSVGAKYPPIIAHLIRPLPLAIVCAP